ncbi:MAG: hypothetical protein ACC742_12630 [Thermoanaerobaculales bacterium]
MSKMMMKVLALVGFVCLAPGVFAGGPLPDGHFRGTGHWIGPDGSSGEYDVETVIAGDVIESTYRYPGVQPGRDKHIVRLTASSDGSIEVTGENEQFNGRGFCLEDECFYRLEAGGVMIEENVRRTDGRLVKFGSKSGDGFRVVWKETLELD